MLNYIKDVCKAYESNECYVNSRLLLLSILFSLVFVQIIPLLVSKDNNDFLCITFLQVDSEKENQETIYGNCFFCSNKGDEYSGAVEYSKIAEYILRKVRLNWFVSLSYKESAYEIYRNIRAPPIFFYYI